MSLLSIRDLTVSFPGQRGWIPVVREVSFDLHQSEFLGLVGESGSGKSMTALSILRLLPENGRIDSGDIRFEGADLLKVPERDMRLVRGGKIAMIFQEPMTALNPVFTVGFQITEAIRAHLPMDRTEGAREAERLLDRVAIPDARNRLNDYPHQLSGGQRQRVMIAMALSAAPEFLIADEPTTALDVTVQAQILELLDELRRDLGLAILLITHDLGVVAETCSRVVVMYAGQVVEEGRVDRLFRDPAHPYTRGLLKAVPKLGARSVDGLLPTIPGQVPEPGRLPNGCAFHPRCSDVFGVCDVSEPQLIALDGGHQARCFLHDRTLKPEARL